MAEQDQNETRAKLAISYIIQSNQKHTCSPTSRPDQQNWRQDDNPNPNPKRRMHACVHVPDMSSHSQSMLWLILVGI